MTSFLIANLIKIISFLPHSTLKYFVPEKSDIIKSTVLFGIIKYESNYKGDNLAFFFLPLLANISRISNEIQLLLNKKEIVNITSTLVLYEKESTNEYPQSLSENNILYSSDNFGGWKMTFLSNLIEKLELYNSFQKISIVIKVKVITNV